MIGVIILAAIVLFAINATDWLQSKVAEDVGALAPPIQKTLSAALPDRHPGLTGTPDGRRRPARTDESPPFGMWWWMYRVTLMASVARSGTVGIAPRKRRRQFGLA